MKCLDESVVDNEDLADAGVIYIRCGFRAFSLEGLFIVPVAMSLYPAGQEPLFT